MSSAAQAYARVANTTSSPRDIEAQALLTAANKLHAVMVDADATYAQTFEALMFNRKLWSVFLSEMTDSKNPMPRNVRQNVANLGLFVMNHTVTVMNDPRPERLDRQLLEVMLSEHPSGLKVIAAPCRSTRRPRTGRGGSRGGSGGTGRRSDERSMGPRSSPRDRRERRRSRR